MIIKNYIFILLIFINLNINSKNKINKNKFNKNIKFVLGTAFTIASLVSFYILIYKWRKNNLLNFIINEKMPEGKEKIEKMDKYEDVSSFQEISSIEDQNDYEEADLVIPDEIENKNNSFEEKKINQNIQLNQKNSYDEKYIEKYIEDNFNDYFLN